MKKVILIIVLVAIAAAAGIFVWQRGYLSLKEKEKASEEVITKKEMKKAMENIIQKLPEQLNKAEQEEQASVEEKEEPKINLPVQNKAYTVNIQNFAFSPPSLTINKDDTVIWINKDSASHTATGSDFDSGTLSTNQSYSHKFSSSGTFSYICSFHPYMQATVIVR